MASGLIRGAANGYNISMSFLTASLFALIVGTWNGNWFPSGRAEHRAHPAVEEATIQAAGKMLREGLQRLDSTNEEDVVLVLNEIRNREVAERLIKAIGRADLTVASISAYRRRDRFDQQQDVILTTLPVVVASWSKWTPHGAATPPRGYAMADVLVDNVVTTRVYAVHLKSNYGAATKERAAENRAKRSAAIDELVAHASDVSSVIVAGDLNADKYGKAFAEETIFAALENVGYANLLDMLPKKKRWTYPNRRYGNSALDYIFIKGLKCEHSPIIQPNENLSDHYAVFARVY